MRTLLLSSLLVSSVVLPAACTHTAQGPSPEASAAAPAETAAFSEEGGAGSGLAAQMPSARPPRGALLPRPGAVGGRPGRALQPPAVAGEVRFVTSGCLAEPTRGEAFPPPEPTRGAPGARVEVTPVRRGVLLAHPLEHACCLSARVDARTEGGVVTVTETLEGEPCRCRCGSTVRSAVGLAAGDYTLRLRVHEPGGERELWQGPVSVLR